MQFYEMFEDLCVRDKVAPSKACKDMGFGKSASATWKYRNSMPTAFNMRIIAKYFNVSLESLMDYENIKDISELKPAAPEAAIIGRDSNPIETSITDTVRKMPVVTQDKLLKYLQFTYPEFFEDEK